MPPPLHFIFSTTSGDFTLAYSGETTQAISYDAGAADITEALGNLSALANANITTESVNCTTPEVTCGWRVTFSGLYGDAEMLVPDSDGLSGNAADVSVVETTKGQIAAEVGGSPVTVRYGFAAVFK